MDRLPLFSAVLAVISLVGIAGLTVQNGRLVRRMEDLEKRAPASVADPAQAARIAALQRSFAVLQSEVAASRPAGSGPVGGVGPDNGDPEFQKKVDEAVARREAESMDKKKAAIIDRMNATAKTCVERDAEKIGLSSEQKESVLQLLQVQIREIAKLDPALGRQRLEEEMERINQDATAKIMAMLQDSQRSKFLETSKGWFGGMMSPKKKPEERSAAEPPPVPPEAPR